MALLCVTLLLGGAAPELVAQEGQPSPVRVVRPGGQVVALDARVHHGHTAVPAVSLQPFGWEVEASDGPSWRLRHAGGAELLLVPGDPFFRWDGEAQQLVDAPYVHEGELWVPAQLVLDFLPFHLPEAYRLEWGGDGPVVRLVEGPAVAEGAVRADGADRRDGAPEAYELSPRSVERPPLVVVIDPGHGGDDLGTVGFGGTREKDVALSLGRALARELEHYEELEVHLTRNSDELVPLWRRGEWATTVKGERSGVFISLHANAMADRSHRGFETYFLSDARTEHERRVAAIENAPLDLADDGEGEDTELGLILNQLRAFDHQHWSDLLAELVHEKLGPVHPGPDLGVKQGPFAVITNALMPAVLVEVGFMSNREEERLLARPAFHADVAGALADAVVEFFRRYPPGRAGGLEGPDPAGSEP